VTHLDVIVVVMCVEHVDRVHGLVLVRWLDGEGRETDDVDFFLDVNATVCVN
jgi:hypothetical protein